MSKFTEDSARRIGRVVKHVERNLRNEKAHRARYNGWNSRWEVGKTNAILSTNCDSGTCGTVGVSIWYWNGVGFADSGQDVTAVCPLLSAGDTIASGTWVAVQKHRRNVWVIIAVQCP